MGCGVQNRGYEGLDPAFAGALQRMVAASGGRIRIGNGLRTRDEQVCLHATKPGLAAKPGSSNHEFGFAVDLVYTNDDARTWAHANAARFGLHFPMSYEPWHIEPIGRDRHSAREAYPESPGTEPHPHDRSDVSDVHDLGTHMRTLAGMMAGGGPASLGDDALFADLGTVASELQSGADTVAAPQEPEAA